MASGLTTVTRTSRVFLDANVFVYADDARIPAKQLKAIELVEHHLRQRTGVISIQVLQEYFAAALRKLNLDAGLAKRKISIYAKFHVVEPNVNSVLSAIDLHRIHGISFWDASILQSAKETGCSILLTEDLQHGQTIDGVKVVNPFL
ncbi:MAG TPA: PIN domain-containing protein [Terracidiphilus sp.]|nr:PIN domain-containing protein [Terracidiphilus sp.]